MSNEMMKKIYIGSDHGGFDLKEEVKEFLAEKFAGFEVKDLGCDSAESVDYPEFGKAVGEAVIADKDSLGIVICGSGVGIGIAANKVEGIRCVTANSTELAKLGREHNGAQVLAMGARTLFMNDWWDIVETFLTTEMDEGDRHKRRRCQLG